MASIPAGALILDLDEACRYFTQWTASDRAKARVWVEKTGVTKFYVPPSGGYAAGHGGPNHSSYTGIAVNGLVMYAGFLHAWPNMADVGGDDRVELSCARGALSTSPGVRSPNVERAIRLCPKCNLDVLGASSECDSCGHDFEAARSASIARYHAAQERRGASDR